MGPSVCFLIPAFNEEKSLPFIIDSLKFNYPKSTIVVVNDESTDSTLLVAKAMKVVVLDLVNNLGIGGAVQTGL